MAKKRIYTKVSAKAVKGFKRMSATKDIFVEPSGNGEFTVITMDKAHKPARQSQAA